MRILVALALVLLLWAPHGMAQSVRTLSPPIVAVAGQVIRDVQITSTSGPCIVLNNVPDVWIDNVELGPCAGNGVRITGAGAQRIRVTNSVIHTERRPIRPVGGESPDKDTGVGVYVGEGASDVLIQGNSFRHNESSVYAQIARDIRVIGNYSHNPLGQFPRGQHFMFNQVQTGAITDNYGQTDLATAPRSGCPTVGLTPCQEDAINLYGASGIQVLRNYLIGGNSSSGCGIILDGGPAPDQNVIEDNILIRTGHCGLGLAGNGNSIRRNKVLDPNIGGGSLGIQIINFTAFPCGQLVISDNIVSNPDGTDYYHSSTRGCTFVTNSGNVLGAAARALLLPIAEKLPAPAPVPPIPYVSSAAPPPPAPLPTPSPVGTRCRVTGLVETAPGQFTVTIACD